MPYLYFTSCLIISYLTYIVYKRNYSSYQEESWKIGAIMETKENRKSRKGSICNSTKQAEKMFHLSQIAVIDIERENRLSRVISLYNKGLNQEEVAQELHVDQSTVNRNLQYIKHEAKIKIEMYLREDILFEYVRYMAGSNEITRHLWEIVENNDTTTREKTNALSCIMQS